MAVNTVNVELLQKTLDAIKANPEHWRQSQWHCGTSHCFAGFTELIANNIPLTTCSSTLKKDSRFFDLQHSFWSTEENAIGLLGLNLPDSERLFWGANTLEDLELMVAELIGSGSLERWQEDDDDSEDDDE